MACEWGSDIDLEGTSIKTKYVYSVFKWKHKTFRKTISHPVHGLPEMVINESASGIFSTFCHFISHGASSARAQFCSFTTKSSSHNIFVPHSVWRYSRDGFTSPCQVLRMADSEGVSPQIVIKLQCGRVLHTSPEFLQHMEDPDVALIPSKVSQFRKEVDLLSDDDLSFLANPRALEPVEEEWLRWHHRLNHLSRTGMIQLVHAGLLPKKFLRFRHSSPFCASCAFGKAHRRQWRHKGARCHPIRSPRNNVPGAQVSVDQMISAQPGLLAQMSGHLTRRRVSCATLFKDHFSGFTFCHLQVSSGHEETLAAKWSFEKYAHSCGVSIKAYRADNGRFGEQAFRNECDLQQQTITFCGVGAHHQNGVAEASVKFSTLGAQTLLLHAQRLWPDVITTMLWPFALLEHVRTMNHYFLDENGKSPYMKFSNVHSTPELGDQHPWGCPVYVLESKL